ncbi:MAG: anthranilate synthase component I family protein [Ruminococcus sp.]|jgi:anthranilate synthase component 1|nr:anthranilate synthase component I family protein [Ruminococcus sp.]
MENISKEGYSLFPIYRKLENFDKSPSEVFLILRGLSNHCFILESAENTGRYTFIGFDPDMEITVKNHVMTINGSMEITESDPKAAIARILENNRSPKVPGLPPFTGGLVGFLSYEYIAYEEPSLPLLSHDSEFNDIDLMMFKKVIAFDFDCCYIIVNSDGSPQSRKKAEFELEYIAGILKNGMPIVPPPLNLESEFAADMDKEAYCRMVERAKFHIKEGDIFQIVLSNRLSAKASGSLFHAYEYQKKVNPSPYMLYFSSDEVEIAGSAPETLVSVHDGVVSTFPLAGTRWRGKTEAEDKALEVSLLADEKERAEHNMLVDLGRNDVGKVSEIGSVKVSRYMDVLRFSHVMHIGSEVTGRLKPGLTAIDAVSAVIPAGTLSGAPKIRACEIIHELEASRRGIYGGALGYLAFSGDADLCIAIRLAYKKGGSVYARSGAGIVADSVPENEYAECANKLAAVINSLGGGKK